MQFYRMLDSLENQVHDRRYLGEPFDESGTLVDGWEFTMGRAFDVRSPLTIPQMKLGTALGFTFGALDMPVIRHDVGSLIDNLASKDIQRIPVTILKSHGCYEILNVIRTVECVDEIRSYVEKWTERDGRPDKLGQYSMVHDLHILSDHAKNVHLFRVKGWDVALICSEPMRRLFEDHDVTGVEFKKV